MFECKFTWMFDLESIKPNLDWLGQFSVDSKQTTENLHKGVMHIEKGQIYWGLNVSFHFRLIWYENYFKLF